MNICKRLKQDHDRQRRLSEKIIETSGDSKQRRSLFDELKRDLEAHAAAEEKVVYAELLRHSESIEQARHSVAEHQEALELVAELERLPMDSGGWIHKFDKLKHAILHHNEEEEEDVFPLIREALGEEPARAMADEFEDAKLRSVA